MEKIDTRQMIGVRERIDRPDVGAVQLRTKKVLVKDGQVVKQLPRSFELWEDGFRLARWEYGKILFLYMKRDMDTAVVV